MEEESDLTLEEMSSLVKQVEKWERKHHKYVGTVDEDARVELYNFGTFYGGFGVRVVMGNSHETELGREETTLLSADDGQLETLYDFAGKEYLRQQREKRTKRLQEIRGKLKTN